VTWQQSSRFTIILASLGTFGFEDFLKS
jgi:hypothetical protein